jgi:uncharacterized protein (TIGR03067 family)
MLTYGLTAVMVGLLIAADTRDDAARKDLDKFQGSWTLISLERDGKKMPPEEARKIKLTILGNKFVLRKDGMDVSEGSFSLDPSGKPKKVDETITAGPNKGKILMAIYEIDDTHHTVCFARAGGKRPTEFSSRPGTGQILQVWKRDKN